MQSDFQYQPDNDGEVFKEAILHLDGRPIRVSACTIQGSKDGLTKKPNEDAFSIVVDGDKLYAAVFDGCSSQKPIDWLVDQTGARFASHFVKTRFEEVAARTEPTRLLAELNNQLNKESMSHQSANVLDIHTLPATTATIAAINVAAHKLELSHVGDTFCILFYADSSSKLITVDRNEAYDNEIFVKLAELAKAKHITPREAKGDASIKQAIKDMLQSTHNRPDGTGQGVVNGDPHAEQYFQNESIHLEGVESILLGSDGLIPPGYTEHTDQGRADLLEILSRGGLDALIKRKHEAEDGDPDWTHIRFKHSDDATGIYIELQTNND